MNKKRTSSLQDLPILRRVLISFFLISVLPLLVAGFYFTYKFLPSYAIIVLGFIMLLGWWIIGQVVMSITKIVKRTAGQVEMDSQLGTSDEVKVLDKAFSQISDKVKSRFEELKEVSKNTEELNYEISKKVSLLSTIMHINDLVSQQKDMKDVFESITARMLDILDIDMCFIVLDDGKGNFKTEELLAKYGASFESISKTEDFLKPVLEKQETVFFDENSPEVKGLENFAKGVCKTDSLVLIPILLKAKVAGILGAGKKQGDKPLSKEDINSLGVFAKHLSFLFEHREMRLRMKELEVKDTESSFYNKADLKKKLNEEIKTAVKRQSSCGFILIKINKLKEHLETYGFFSFEKIFRTISVVLNENLSNCKIGRLAGDELGIIAVEAGKAELERTAEDVVSKIKSRLSSSGDIALSWAISENPIDGSSADELIDKAHQNLKK